MTLFNRWRRHQDALDEPGAGRGSGTAAAGLRWPAPRRSELGHLERRRRTAVEDRQLLGLDLDLPVASFGFSLPGRRDATLPLTARTNSLRSSAAGGQEFLAVRFEDNLGDAVAVAQVDEHQGPDRGTCSPSH